jgi:SAM-dependent methyltransferase
MIIEKDTSMQNFSTLNMYEIFNTLEKKTLPLNTKEIVEFEVLNPDILSSSYAGSIVNIDGKDYIYRGYKAWVDLAQTLGCRMLTPTCQNPNFVTIRFEKLNSEDSFHKSADVQNEKYGTASSFSNIHKNEEPSFLVHYLKALKNVDINRRLRVLNLGINSGDEFEIIQKYATNFESMELVGIDYCDSAIKEAKNKFSACNNISLLNHDINDLESLNLEKFDLIISIGTLQSSNLDFNPLFMSLVQNYLKKDGAMILGFPNCRWIDGEMIYGAKAKNYPYSEMSLLYKDAIFCKKYLQQKKFRVTLTGKDYIFLTATSIRKN